MLRITHASGPIHDTDFAYLLRSNPPESVFADFIAETIQEAEIVGGTVVSHRPCGLVDLAAHVIEEHAEVGECVGNCGWRPGDSVVIRYASEPRSVAHRLVDDSLYLSARHQHPTTLR